MHDNDYPGVTVTPSIHGLHRHYLAYTISQELT